MKQKAGPQKPAAEQVIKDIRRATRKHHSADDKIRIVLERLRGEDTIRHSAPPRRHCREPLLQMVERVPRLWQEAAGRGT
jgi:hypothetical protein